MNSKNWIDSQKEYWDDISSKYSSLYSNPWSKLEDAETKRQFETILVSSKNTRISMLDLACGQGFGLDIVEQLDKKYFIEYSGIDISVEMIGKINKRHMDTCYLSKMCDLSMFHNESIRNSISF